MEKKLFLLVLLFLSICCLLCCAPYSDQDQVQTAPDVSAFKPFSSPPRVVVCGPYCLNVKTDSAVIAWEEKILGDTLRHVEVSVPGLAPGTEYVYRVNGAKKDGRMVTAPADAAPFSFFIVSDTRAGAEVASQISEEMIALDPDAAFVIHAGDMVIDQHSQESWQADWWSPLSDLLLHFSIYPVMGNHEEGSVWYPRYFSSLGGQGINYSFNWGRVHFAVLDVNEESFLTGELLAWLTSDLKEHQDADFIAVCHHLPAYASTPDGDSGTGFIQEKLVPLYEQYGVKLVLSGDVHCYQHNLKNNIHYLISAGGGSRLYEHGLPLEGMTLNLYKNYNFIRCRVADRSMQLTVFDPAGDELDNFTIAADSSSEINARIIAQSDKSEVQRGEQFRTDFFIEGAAGLDTVSFTLEYYKDTPPGALLTVVDAQPLAEGVQIEEGLLGGVVTANSADNSKGLISYGEDRIGGLSASTVKVASILFTVPDDEPITAFYLLPRFSLHDTSGKEIPCFMGGAKVTIKK
jgi:3',5'-cyclic AMP phosphodiesterase CpdA